MKLDKNPFLYSFNIMPIPLNYYGQSFKDLKKMYQLSDASLFIIGLVESPKDGPKMNFNNAKDFVIQELTLHMQGSKNTKFCVSVFSPNDDYIIKESSSVIVIDKKSQGISKKAS